MSFSFTGVRCGLHLMHVDSFESVAIDDVLVLVEADMRSNDAATSCSLDVCWGNMEVVLIAESSLQGSVLDFLLFVDFEAFSPHLMRFSHLHPF